MHRKKKVLLHSNSCIANTGFGRHNKHLLSYLYKTGKYDIVEYAAGPLTWSHPVCKAMPWKCYGALPDNPAEIDRFKGDPAKMQAIHYGEYNINRVLKEEKPDVLIMLEDIWGLPYLDKPWINKFQHVFWTPIDSLPLLPVFEQNKDKFKNLWVKARFAKDALAEKGIQAEYMPALIDKNDFNVLDDETKKKIRRKYGIADNTLIFGFVFRNQLRKLVGTLIEAFSMFQKDNPNIDSKLFLHTNWSESDGWRIPEFAERFKVKQEDILTTYVCKDCRHVSVKPFVGEGLPCQVCKAEKSTSTSGVSLGVSDNELCEIYNILDAYIHPVTSGGFEMPVLEAMLCGLPTATIDYSFGKNFTINEDVYKLESFFYSERGSQFDKAQVKPESIKEFMQKIHEMPISERKNLGKRIRDWAAEEFDADKICKKIEDFIDSTPFNEYDFNFDEPVEEKPPTIESLIDLTSNKKRLLYVEPGSLGECLDSSQVLEALSKKFNPKEWDFYVATLFPAMFDHLNFVKSILPYDPVFEDVFGMEGIENHKGFFDVAFHPRIVRSCLDFYKNNY